jgi:hypothetical protein
VGRLEWKKEDGEREGYSAVKWLRFYSMRKINISQRIEDINIKVKT